MENTEKDRIKLNISALVLYTICDAKLLTYCYQKGLLSLSDIDEINAEEGDLDKAYKFFQILLTKPNFYPSLVEALRVTFQSDVVELLETGVAPPTLKSASRVETILHGKKRPIFDVSPPVPLFTGRRKELDELHKKVMRSRGQLTVISQLTSVSGLGGIGKTQLSRQYVQEHREDFDGNCLWFNADSENSLSESFRNLASDELGIRTKNVNGSEKNIQVVVRDVFKFFENRKCLFIFDNAEKAPWLNQFLPMDSLLDSHRPCILLTSRTREWDRGIEVLEIKELELIDAINMVKKGLGLETDASQDDIITKLVTRLQCFPLALQQAISYIEVQLKDNGQAISTYLEAFDKRQEELLDFYRTRLFDEYSMTTLTTWKLTVDRIGQDKNSGEVAINILYAMAYLSPDKIKRELFAGHSQRMVLQGFPRQNGIFKCLRLGCPPLPAKVNVDEGLRLLVKYSMIREENRYDLISIHRLVQEVTRIELISKQLEGKILKAVIKIIIEEGLDESQIQENLDHLLTAWSHVWKYSDVVTKLHWLPDRLAWFLYKKGRDNETVNFGSTAVEKLSLLLGEEHEEIVHLYNHLALALTRLGRKSEAFDIMHSVYEKYKLMYGEYDGRTLSAINNLGYCYYSDGRYEEALEFYQIVCKIEKMLNIEEGSHRHINNTLNMADSLVQLGRTDEALAIAREIYDHHRHILDKANLIRLKALLGICHNNILDFQGGLEILQENLEDLADLSAEEQVHMRVLLDVSGILLRNLGDYRGALDKHKKAAQISNEVFGPEHRQSLLYAVMFGGVLIPMGKYEDAIKLLEEAIPKLDLIMRGDNFKLVQAKVDLAMGLEKMGGGNVSRALAILEEEKEKVMSQDNGESELQNVGRRKTLFLISLRKVMAECLSTLGNFDGALKIMEDISEEVTEMGSLERMMMWKVLRVHGNILRSKQAYEEALDKHCQALEMAVHIFGEENFHTLMTRVDFAMDLIMMGKQDESIIQLEEVARKLESLLEEDNFHVARVKVLLADALIRFGGGHDNKEKGIAILREGKAKIGENYWGDLAFFKNDVCKIIERIEIDFALSEME